MLCGNCGAQNPDDARFCGECGNSLQRQCPHCGTATELGQKFCFNCGGALTAQMSAQAPQVPRITPPASQGGERKTLTVLFADIVGSTSLVADLDPESAVKVLKPILDAMQAAVRRYSGTVNQRMGDGIMALFGAPVALEDHAVMGCHAALAMKAATAKLGEHGVKLRIGLHSGDVLVRSVGYELSVDYDALGPTVHLAARMEQLAEPDAILISEETYKLASGLIKTHEFGRVQLKGIQEPVRVYQVTGNQGLRSRWSARASQGLSPLVGREADLDLLQKALDRTEAGFGQVVGVSGQAGIGKSRLVHEFLQRYLPKNQWELIQADAVPYGDAISYHPISNFLRSWLGVTPDNTQDDVKRRIESRFRRASVNRRNLVPAIQSLLDLPIDDDGWNALDPPQRRQRVMDAIRLFVQERADRRPVALFFEDLHWMDAETLAVIDNLVQTIAGSRILLVLTYRPEFTHTWGGKSYFRSLTMAPLETDAVDELLDHLIGASPSTGPLKNRLGNMSHGTPLYLEELVRALVEDGALVGSRGDYFLTRDIGEIKIPNSVQAIISARIDNLNPEGKSLLQVAAVLGKAFLISLLRDVSGVSTDRLADLLARLQAGEFIFASRVFPEEEYSFRHMLIQDVAYNGALRDNRRSLHLRALEAIEARYRGREDEVIENLAHHAQHAEQWQKAFGLLERAGNKAIERSAYSEAIRHFEAALSVSANLQQDRAIIRRTIALRLGLRAAFGPMGELVRMYDHLAEAEKDAEVLDDPDALAAVKTAQTFVFTLNGDLEDAVVAGNRAVEIATGSSSPDLKASASVFLGQVLQFRGDFVAARNALESNLDYLRGEARLKRLGTTSTTSVLSLYVLASVLASMGEFKEALSAGKEALEIAEETGRPYDLSLALGGLGAAFFRKGDYAAALTAFERGRDVCLKGDIRSMLPWLSAQAGCVYALKGDLNAAEILLADARQASAGMKLVYYHAWAIAFSGTSLLLAGRTEEARAMLEEALSLARHHGYCAIQVWCLRHLASEELLAEMNSETRLQLLREAINIANSSGMTPEEALCYSQLAVICDVTDRSKEASNAREKAASLRKGLGLTSAATGNATAVPEFLDLD